MPPIHRSEPGALAGSALARNRFDQTRMPKSGGLLRDQQTLNETTVGHDTSCGITLTGEAFGRDNGTPSLCHLTVNWTSEA